MSNETISKAALEASKRVNVEPDEHSPGRFKLTVGLFHSFVGYQTCKAAGIPKAANLPIDEAKTHAAKLQKWINVQENVKTR